MGPPYPKDIVTDTARDLGQLAAERQAHAALERIPAIEAPQEASEAAETVEEAPDRAETRPAAGGAQGGVRRPWWRRMFGS